MPGEKIVAKREALDSFDDLCDRQVSSALWVEGSETRRTPDVALMLGVVLGPSEVVDSNLEIAGHASAQSLHNFHPVERSCKPSAYLFVKIDLAVYLPGHLQHVVPGLNNHFPLVLAPFGVFVTATEAIKSDGPLRDVMVMLDEKDGAVFKMFLANLVISGLGWSTEDWGSKKPGAGREQERSETHRGDSSTTSPLPREQVKAEKGRQKKK